jgi:hypothetical protein
MEHFGRRKKAIFVPTGQKIGKEGKNQKPRLSRRDNRLVEKNIRSLSYFP